MECEINMRKIGYLVAGLAILGISFIGTASALDLGDPDISVKVLAPEEFMPDSTYFIGIKYIVNEVSLFDEPASHPEILFDAGSAEIVANLSGRFDATNTTHTCTFNSDEEIAEERNETVVVIIKTGSSGSVDLQVTAKAHDDDDYDDIVTATDSISVPIKELNPNSVEYFKELAEQRKMLFEQYLYLVNETLMGTPSEVAKMNDEAMQTALFKVTSASCEMVLEEVISSGAGVFLDPVTGVEGVYDYMDFTNDAINGFEGNPLFSTMNWIFDWCDYVITKMALDMRIHLLFHQGFTGPDNRLNQYVSLIDEEITCWNNSDFSGLKTVLREEEEFREYHFDYLRVSNGIDSYDSLPEDTRTYVKILYKSVGNSLESDYRLIKDHIEPAVREPSPRFVSVPGNTVNLGGGDKYEFVFKIKNTGGTANDSYFSLSVSEGLEITDYSSDKPNGEFEIYHKGDSIWHHDDYPVPAEYALLDWYRPWLGAEEEQTLKVRIKGTGAGDQWVKYRLAFDPKLEGLSFVRNPASGELDQQGWHAYRIDVDVGEVSNNKPSADFSFALCQTSMVYQEYEVYENEGLTVDGNTGYYLTDWMGEQYVAINGRADKLCKLLVEFEDDTHLTLGTGEKWDLGGGFALVANQIDTADDKVWLSLKKHDKELDDKVISAGDRDSQQGRVYTYTAEIGGEADIPVFSCYVDAIFRGTDTNIVLIKYAFLINNSTLSIDTGDGSGVMSDLSVEFTSLSTDPDGDALSYYWDFDDGSSGAAENPTHEYESGGGYDVTLTVTDTKGLSDYKTKRVHVNETPEADFGYSADGARVVFVSNSTDDGSIVSWDWDFGDEWTGTGGVVGHEYSSAGSYEVTLTVTDDDGATDSVTKTISTEVFVPEEEWNVTFGEISCDRTYHVQQTTDGGYILAGSTGSYSADHADFWLMKTDSSGKEVWNKTFGGADYDDAYSVQQTTDGGYILAGDMWSYGAGDGDFCLVKTDSNGDEQWSKTFGGLDYDRAWSVQQTTDGGYILAGRTESYGAGDGDFWLVKTDSEGNKQWNKTFGGVADDAARSVQQTVDGGYVLAGWTQSYGAGSYDFWLMKTDSNGIKQWNKTFGGTDWDVACSVQQTRDGGYVVAGYTKSYGAGSSDFWLVKTDSNGNEMWNKTFGGTTSDNAFSVQQTSDSGYIVAGNTRSYGAGSDDAWLIKLSAEGGVDATAPALTITSPTPDTTTHTPTITVTGTASDPSGIASVTVNGVPAAGAHAWSTWSAEVALVVGENTITVVATDNAGNVATETVTVWYASSTADIYVNESGWWCDGGAFNPSSTPIQSAVDAANAGDTIFVYSGSYTENVNVTKQLILRGVDTGSGKPVVDAGGNRNAIILSADGIMLEGFVAINSSGGIKATSSNNIITGNNARNNEWGIRLCYSNNNTIKGNIVSNNSWDGIHILYSNHNTIIGNNVSYNSKDGIQLYSSSNNSITENIVNKNNYEGIRLYTSNDNTIASNNVSYTSKGGIQLYSSRDNTITNNGVSNNDEGIFLNFSSYNTLYNNNLANNIDYNAYDIDGENQWDNGTIGNHYSNFDEPGEGCADTDCNCICDSSHSIQGGSSVDRYPMASWGVSLGDGGITEIAYDDGELDCQGSMGSDTGWGHGVLFEIGAPTTVTKVKIYGRIYDANPSFIPPGFGETFDVEIRDSSLNKLDSVTYNYDDYFTESYDWAMIDIPDVLVDGDFYIWLNTKSYQSPDIGKGILIGIDFDSLTGNSFTIETTTDSILETRDSNWMIRAVVYSASDENHAPEITSISAAPSVVGQGETSTITVVASDQDGDDLSYSYDPTGGEISGSGSIVTWTAPVAAPSAPPIEGTFRVDVTVSDGKESVTDSVYITVTEEEKPDLTVTKINYNPQNPEVEDDVTVNSAVIENVGGADCNSPFNVALFINDAKVKTVGVNNLAAGDSGTIDFNYQWQNEGKPYVIKVVADDDNDIEELDETNNKTEVSFKPKPWLKITTDKSTYKGDGEDVTITIEFYTSNKNDFLLIQESCDGHTEYSDKIDLSSETSGFSIELPALPIYNSEKHTISGSLLTLAGTQGILCSDTAEYDVEPTEDIDMIVLTKIEKLDDQFYREDWRQILYDIQLATDDGGILLYADETYDEQLISGLIDNVVFDLQTIQNYNIQYLFILGGDDVIPYRVDRIYDKKDKKWYNATSDQPYWAFRVFGHTPVINYARLPTTRSFTPRHRDLDRYLNAKVFGDVLKNETNHPKTINNALVISGRDIYNADTDDNLQKLSDYVKEKLQNTKNVHNLAEYALNEDGSKVEKTYECTDVETADLIWFGGHGATRSISMDNNYNISVCTDKHATEFEIYENLRFYNGLDSGDYFKFEVKIPAASTNPEFSGTLSLPVVLTTSCLTANHAKDYEKFPLSEAFMHFNAGSYAGFGNSIPAGTGCRLTEAYFDQVVVNQDLGAIFYNSMHAGYDKIKKNYTGSGWLEHYIKNLDYFIQFGYPKWNIDPDERDPDYSDPILPSNIDFDVINYNITTSSGTTIIEFNGTLDGTIVSSTDWMLQGTQ